MTKKEGQLLEYNILITLILMKIHPVLRERVSLTVTMPATTGRNTGRNTQ